VDIVELSFYAITWLVLLVVSTRLSRQIGRSPGAQFRHNSASISAVAMGSPENDESEMMGA